FDIIQSINISATIGHKATFMRQFVKKNAIILELIFRTIFPMQLHHQYNLFTIKNRSFFLKMTVYTQTVKNTRST
ncbi:hypothetical protein, partial [Escherichia coli]|uniref:hypothetical protein n=1 Tax=Escherichia coli TaxID=562 RepID=UPI001CCCF260